MEREYRLKPGEATADGRLSLLTARCVGSCGLAPVVVLDRELGGKLTPEQLGHWLEKRLAYDA
jgi:bidirectional [NiFe] hydrogenase diaphorase subunit